MEDIRIKNISKFMEIMSLEKDLNTQLDDERFKLSDSCNHDICVFLGGDKKYYKHGSKVFSYIYSPCKCLFCGEIRYHYDFSTIDLSADLDQANEKYDQLQLLTIQILKDNPNINNTDLFQILNKKLQDNKEIDENNLAIKK